MNTFVKYAIFTTGCIVGICIAIAISSFAKPVPPVMTVDFGTQKCVNVDGDSAKCKLYSKHEVVIRNSAF